MKEVIAAVVGAIIAAAVGIFLHYARRPQYTDKQILLFLRMCLDRPALKTPFADEASSEDFDKAIEDTITAINTGALLHRRDRLILAQGGTRHHLSSTHARTEMAAIEKSLQQIRADYRQATASGLVRVFEYEGQYFKPEKDALVCKAIDNARVKLLVTFNALSLKEVIDPIEFAVT